MTTLSIILIAMLGVVFVLIVWAIVGTVKEVGISNSTVSRMLKDDYTPFETCARYFSDFIREREWFLDL